MANKLSTEQKRLQADLWIIVLVSLTVLGIYMALQNQVTAFIRDEGRNILLRLLLSAAFQFGLAGMGISLVSVIRKESLLAYGLKRKGLLLSITLSLLCCVPYLIFIFTTGSSISYLPFQNVWTTKEILASGFPINVIGMTVTAIAWGFFEGFNYVVISDKINKLFPSKNVWLNWGAISSAILCILIHGAIGVTVEGIIEMFTILVIIYGMLMVKAFTGNAWGSVFVFLLFWNAFSVA